METIRVTAESHASKFGGNLPGAPVGVAMEIPLQLIDMAKCYPAIDWNEVMRYAVENFDAHRAAQPEVRVTENLAFAQTVRAAGIRTCGVCGLPTIVDLRQTYCSVCHQLLCTTCQEDGHIHNFGPPVGMEPVDF